LRRNTPKLLAISLAVNVFLAVVLGTLLLRQETEIPRGTIGRLLQALPPPDRQAFDESLAAVRRASAQDRDLVAAALLHLAGVTEQSQAPPEDLARALAEWHQAVSRFARDMDPVLQMRILALTADGRARFAAAARNEAARLQAELPR
jgi:uncharacterized membrane protein